MNRMLVIPVTVLFLISVIVAFQGFVQIATYDPDDNATGTVDGNSTTIDLKGDGEGEYSFNIWITTVALGGAIYILLASVGVGILSGVNVLGSGLSTFAQKLLFSSLLYLGIWVCLSVAAMPTLAGGVDLMTVLTASDLSTWSLMTIFGGFLWVILTIMYIIGFAIEINGGDV